MIVGSDTTPLRYLAVLDCLDFLPRLFGAVHCPGNVVMECRHPRAPSVLRAWAENPPSWLIVAEITAVDPDLTARLDAGEAAAIALAQYLQAEVILMDECECRRCAQAKG